MTDWICGSSSSPSCRAARTDSLGKKIAFYSIGYVRLPYDL